MHPVHRPQLRRRYDAVGDLRFGLPARAARWLGALPNRIVKAAGPLALRDSHHPSRILDVDDWTAERHLRGRNSAHEAADGLSLVPQRQVSPRNAAGETI